MSRNGPLRLTAIVLSHSSSVTLGGIGVRRCDAGVVDEHVDPSELRVRGLDERLALVPPRDVAGNARARRPARRTSSAASSQASSLRLAITMSAPAPRERASRSRARAPSLRR